MGKQIKTSPRSVQSAKLSSDSSNDLRSGRELREPKRPETCYSGQPGRLFDLDDLDIGCEFQSVRYSSLGTNDLEDVLNGKDNEGTSKKTKFRESDEDFVLESLGCLANLNLKDLDFSRVLTELQLLDWIQNKLTAAAKGDKRLDSSGYESHLPLPSDLLSTASVLPCYPMCSDDDVILETVRLVGTVCQDPSAAKMVVDADLIAVLIQLLNGGYDATLVRLP